MTMSPCAEAGAWSEPLCTQTSRRAALTCGFTSPFSQTGIAEGSAARMSFCPLDGNWAFTRAVAPHMRATRGTNRTSLMFCLIRVSMASVGCFVAPVFALSQVSMRIERDGCSKSFHPLVQGCKRILHQAAAGLGEWLNMLCRLGALGRIRCLWSYRTDCVSHWIERTASTTNGIATLISLGVRTAWIFSEPRHTPEAVNWSHLYDSDRPE